MIIRLDEENLLSLAGNKLTPDMWWGCWRSPRVLADVLFRGCDFCIPMTSLHISHRLIGKKNTAVVDGKPGMQVWYSA